MTTQAKRVTTVLNYPLFGASKGSYVVYNLTELRYFDVTKLENERYLLNMNFGGQDVNTTVSSFEFTENFLELLLTMGEVSGCSYNRKSISVKLPKYFFVHVSESKTPNYSVYNLSKYSWYSVDKVADNKYVITIAFGENHKTFTVSRSQLTVFERAFNSFMDTEAD